jgi:hypothetical protein
LADPRSLTTPRLSAFAVNFFPLLTHTHTTSNTPSTSERQPRTQEPLLTIVTHDLQLVTPSDTTMEALSSAIASMDMSNFTETVEPALAVSRTPASFLTLPRELRYRIYELLPLIPQGVVNVDNRQHSTRSFDKSPMLGGTTFVPQYWNTVADNLTSLLYHRISAYPNTHNWSSPVRRLRIYSLCPLPVTGRASHLVHQQISS